MALRQTENLHPSARNLDGRADDQILSLLLAGQIEALMSVQPALPQIVKAAQLMAQCLRAGGRLCYAGAGSSALMANADGIELPGTYSIAPDRILLRMAGGIPTTADMPGDTEDDAEDGARAAVADGLAAGDLVIAVTASGSTPYPLALARTARQQGASVVAVACNEAAQIFEGADVAVCLSTPPEIVAGSTRMGAATAQKVALNLMSTLAAIRLGQVHDGMMVGLKADNAKLRQRAAGIVATISGADEAAALAALDQVGGAVKEAVLVAMGEPPDRARTLLQQEGGILRAALARRTRPAGGRRELSKTEKTNQGSET